MGVSCVRASALPSAQPAVEGAQARSATRWQHASWQAWRGRDEARRAGPERGPGLAAALPRGFPSREGLPHQQRHQVHGAGRRRGIGVGRPEGAPGSRSSTPARASPPTASGSSSSPSRSSSRCATSTRRASGSRPRPGRADGRRARGTRRAALGTRLRQRVHGGTAAGSAAGAAGERPSRQRSTRYAPPRRMRQPHGAAMNGRRGPRHFSVHRARSSAPGGAQQARGGRPPEGRDHSENHVSACAPQGGGRGREAGIRSPRRRESPAPPSSLPVAPRRRMRSTSRATSARRLLHCAGGGRRAYRPGVARQPGARGLEGPATGTGGPYGDCFGGRSGIDRSGP